MKSCFFPYDERSSYRAVKDLFESVCSSTQSPIAAKALKLSREGSDLELSRLEILAADYSDAETFRVDYSITKYLSKWTGLKTGVDTRKVALLAFSECEDTVRKTNNRLKAHGTAFVEPILHVAQRLIARVLGEFDYSLVDGKERWSGGACTDLRRSHAYLDAKITKLPIPVTRGAVKHLHKAIVNDLHWSKIILGLFPEGPYCLLPSLFEIVNGSRIDTVPKTMKTDRTIAIEPRGNMFLQKGVGRFIRKRLKGYGVNLDDQAVNQELASVCEDLQLATIDLTMASDSIALELIFELLPVDWAIYLNELRSPQYQLPGSTKWIPFEKFSSMGNGFTFELESLLFWALSKASMCGEGNLAVYGDDIILPRRDAHVLISTLAYCGFEVNDQKSFIDGDFFESCGKHYFQGIDVTPMYQKEVLSDLTSDLRFVNRVARFLIRSAVDDKLGGPWLKPWKALIRRRATDRGSLCLPFGSHGDDGYLINHELHHLVRGNYARNYGWSWNVAVASTVSIPADDEALLAYALRRGVVNETPFNGRLQSREQSGRLSKSTRWIEPSWEFSLD